MKVLYFAWIRTKLGLEEEDLELPEGVGTVSDLLSWMKDRNERFADVLKDDGVIRVAVNQAHASGDTELNNDDEVALFPPITGGSK